MVGIEHLNKLKENINFFDCSEKDFDNLLNTDITIMGLMDERVYKITPLLIQIANYAYGSRLYHDLECRYYNETGECFDTPIGEIMDVCQDYMEILSNNLCYHPTVLIYIDLKNGANLYDNMFDNMAESLVHADEEFKEKTVDFIDKVDEKILKYKDSLEDRMCITLNNAKSWKDLLKLFGIYGRCGLNAQMLVLDEYVAYPIDEGWVRYYNENKRDAYCTKELYKMMKIINDKLKYDKYSEDEELIDLLESLEEAFELYKGYQNDYIKNSYKEAKIFEKCNKM